MKKPIILAGLAAIGLVLAAGTANAAFQVRNKGQIDYYSNVVMAFKYTVTDTADIRVLFGPHMYLSKNIKNEVTGDSSGDMVLAGRGDTVTITLYAANNVAGADTAAWHTVVTDTFNILTQVGAGQNATVGPNAADSFTYVMGSESCALLAGVDGIVAPDSIAYYSSGGGWTAWFAYDGNRETNAPGGNPANIQGIRWYWRYIPSLLDPYDNPTNLPFNLRVWFQIKKNDN